MSINLKAPVARELKPRIVVYGVGGAGGNAVNNMIAAELSGVDFVVANTDAQALAHSLAERRIQLGVSVTQGLGAGSRPEVGRAAAEEALDQIVEHLQGCHMAFISAGMGGGTGTGAAPVIARAASELGILTVGVVTKPFHFEGPHRMRIADAGIEELQQYVDTLIVIPNQNLFRIANEKTGFVDAFRMADNVLHSGVRGITDLMVVPGLINLDFADVRAVMSEMGKAMMGTGEAEGENRAKEAAERAIANPLLDETSMKGARGVLINITGGPDLTLFEVDEAATRIRAEVDPDANIIVGSALNESLTGKMRVSVVATGIDAPALAPTKPSATVTQLVRPAQRRSIPTPATAPTFGQTAAKLFPGENVGIMAQAPVAQAHLAYAPVAHGQAAHAAQAELPAVGRTHEEPGSARFPAQAAMPAAVAGLRGPAARTERRDDPFIAPRPAAAPARREALRAPDPFQEAAVVNGGATTADKPRRPGFFSRVAMAARLRPENAPAEGADKAPAPAAQAARPAGLSGLEPADRPAAAKRDDDLLEIPAFLRRQSN